MIRGIGRMRKQKELIFEHDHVPSLFLYLQLFTSRRPQSPMKDPFITLKFLDRFWPN